MIFPPETVASPVRERNGSPIAKKSLAPPAFAALPVRRATRSIAFSSTLHTMALAIVIWIPGHVPIPVVLERPAEEMKVRDDKPITFEALPPIKSLDAKAEPASKAAPKAIGLKSAESPAPPKRDYAGPQEIISIVPHATNRVQTILRPDLASPPAIKFPLRLQSVVMLKAPAAPQVPRDAVLPKLQVTAPPRVEIPVMTRTVAEPELTLVPVKAVPAQTAPATSAQSTATPAAAAPQAEKPPAVVDMRGTAKKSVIVLNAVNAIPDPHVQIPDAQLAGKFVVGPPLKSSVPTLAPGATATARTSAGDNVVKEDGVPGANLAPPHAGRGNQSAGTDAPASGKGSGGSGAPGTSSRAGITIASAGTTGSPGLGIAISGAASGNGNATPAPNPIKRTYGLTITAAGGSGGASRDIGVFGRTEIVYSVAIPMSDAGCPSDWPMQYALLNPRSRGAGLMEPPVATKKVAAFATGELAQQNTPVFVRGVIDEKGKLVGLQTVVMHDPRGELAIQALEKWEFLPAVLGGAPVASKVLIGVVVAAGK